MEGLRGRSLVPKVFQCLETSDVSTEPRYGRDRSVRSRSRAGSLGVGGTCVRAGHGQWGRRARMDLLQVFSCTGSNMSLKVVGFFVGSCWFFVGLA